MEKTKTNKKSKSIIVLLVAILLCVAIVLSLSGVTLAKYISSKQVSTQTANVAKWGWQVGLDSDKWFSNAYGYEADYTNNVAISYPNTDSASVGVKASSSDNIVVAPGTEGSLTFNIAGSAEVRSQITVAVADSDSSDDSDSDTTAETIQLKWNETSGSTTTEKTYEPIKWTLTKKSSSTDTSYGDVYYTTDSDGSYSISTTSSNNKVEGVGYEVLAGVLNSMTKEIAPNGTYDYAGYYKLSWEWPFEADSNASDPDKDTENLYDTILGAIRGGASTESKEEGEGASYNASVAYADDTATETNETSSTETAAYTTLGPKGEIIDVYSNNTAKVYAATDTKRESTPTVYTATTSLTFGLTITVEQVQGTATTNNVETND